MGGTISTVSDPILVARQREQRNLSVLAKAMATLDDISFRCEGIKVQMAEQDRKINEATRRKNALCNLEKDRSGQAIEKASAAYSRKGQVRTGGGGMNGQYAANNGQYAGNRQYDNGRNRNYQ